MHIFKKKSTYFVICGKQVFKIMGNVDKLVWVSLIAHISVYQVLPLCQKN